MADITNIKPLTPSWPTRSLKPSGSNDERRQKKQQDNKKNRPDSGDDKQPPQIDEYV